MFATQTVIDFQTDFQTDYKTLDPSSLEIIFLILDIFLLHSNSTISPKTEFHDNYPIGYRLFISK